MLPVVRRVIPGWWAICRVVKSERLQKENDFGHKGVRILQDTRDRKDGANHPYQEQG